MLDRAGRLANSGDPLVAEIFAASCNRDAQAGWKLSELE
jgi:hypothetical protein